MNARIQRSFMPWRWSKRAMALFAVATLILYLISPPVVWYLICSTSIRNYLAIFRAFNIAYSPLFLLATNVSLYRKTLEFEWDMLTLIIGETGCNYGPFN